MENMDNEIEENKATNTLESPPLIPGLPDHLAQLCLSPVPPALLHSVCNTWRRLIYSPTFPPFYSLYTFLYPKSAGLVNSSSLHTNLQLQEESNSLGFFCFNHFSSKWESLPPPPPSNPPLSFVYRHPSFISRILPIQSLTVSNNILLLAGTTENFLPALERPLVFNPLSKSWFLGPPFLTPRRWCITGSDGGGAVYVISGMGLHYQSDVARSVEKWDMKEEEKGWRWENMAELKDGRFSREANESVEYRGKLYMVNVKGNGVKEGAVYNLLTNQWEEMPVGMLAGWNGPAAVNENQEMYVIDQATGALSRYDSENDGWEKLIRSPEHLKGADQVAAGRGRVCAVCAAGGTPRIVVVDVVAKPARFFIVHPPQGMEVVAIHILPRMNPSDH